MILGFKVDEVSTGVLCAGCGVSKIQADLILRLKAEGVEREGERVKCQRANGRVV